MFGLHPGHLASPLTVPPILRVLQAVTTPKRRVQPTHDKLTDPLHVLLRHRPALVFRIVQHYGLPHLFIEVVKERFEATIVMPVL